MSSGLVLLSSNLANGGGGDDEDEEGEGSGDEQQSDNWVEEVFLRDPSAETEEETDYNGFLSYASEWHASAIGAVSGLYSGLAYGEGYTTVALTVLGAVVFLSLGIRLGSFRITKEINIDEDVRREVNKESWYAGGMAVIFFLVGLAITVLFPEIATDLMETVNPENMLHVFFVG